MDPVNSYPDPRIPFPRGCQRKRARPGRKAEPERDARLRPRASAAGPPDAQHPAVRARAARMSRPSLRRGISALSIHAAFDRFRRSDCRRGPPSAASKFHVL